MVVARRAWGAHSWVLPAIALGAMLGASGRYALGLAWPAGPDDLPAATFVTNVAGCLLIGALMVFLVEAGGAHFLARPFLGVGVLGGFTTFSTYAVQTSLLLRHDRPVLAAAYFFGTVAAALVAVAAGVVGARGVLGLRRWWTHRRKESG
jgi:CrcB protein